MARVVLPSRLAEFVGEASEVEVAGGTVRQVVRALEERFPGVASVIESEMSVAIDGEIYSDPMMEPVDDGSEVHFLPRMQGG